MHCKTLTLDLYKTAALLEAIAIMIVTEQSETQQNNAGNWNKIIKRIKNMEWCNFHLANGMPKGVHLFKLAFRNIL